MRCIKALGVTLSSELSMSAHVCSILESCSRAMYGLRTLRAQGMQKECLHEVFRSTISQAYLCKSSLVGLLLCRRYQEARQLYQQKQEKPLLQFEISTGQATVC